MQHRISIFFRNLVPRRWHRQASIIGVVILFDCLALWSYVLVQMIHQQFISHIVPFQWTNLIGWAIILTLWTGSAYCVFKILQDPRNAP